MFSVMAKNQKYEALNGNDSILEEAAIKDPLASNTKSKAYVSQHWTLATLFASLILCAIALALFVHQYRSTSILRAGQLADEDDLGKWQSCGDSPSEARQRGCTFDLANFSWQFDPCMDHELSEEFTTAYDWKYFADEDLAIQVPLEVVQQGLNDMYVSWGCHITHCLFSWRQMNRAFNSNRRLNADISNFNHTLHCEARFLNRTADFQDFNTMVKVNYPPCKLYPGEHGYDF